MSKLVNLFKQPTPDGTYDDAARREAYAQALRERAMRQRGPAAGGPVQAQYGIGEGLTQLAEALLARRAGRSAIDAKKAADTQQTQQNDATIGEMLPATQMQARRADPSTGQLGQSVGRVENMQSDALSMALRGQDPQAIGKFLAERKLAALMPDPQDPFTLGVGDTRFSGSGELIAEGGKPANADKWQTKDEVLPDGRMQTYAFNTATKQYEPVGDPYKPIDKQPNITVNSGASNRPAWKEIEDPANPGRKIWVDLNNPNFSGPASGNETKAGTRENDRQFAMQGINETLNEAETLLSGGVWDPKTGAAVQGAKGEIPTGSGVGSMVDSAAAFIGVTPDGAKTADRLDALGASLTGKVPRFEGPQSNYDVQLYKEAAAKVGDRTIPPERRLEALKTVRGLMSKYERLGQDPFGAGQPAAPAGAAPAAPAAGGGLSPQEEAELAALRKRFGK